MSTAHNAKPHTLPGKMEVPYRNYVGELASEFYVKLRDEKKLFAAKCPKCGSVYMPPQSICGDCFIKMTELVELKGKGTLVTFTEVHYKEPMQPVEPPFVYGIVKLDGADTGMLHMIGECKPADLKIGMQVQAVFADKRAGNILDIKYFKPAKE